MATKIVLCSDNHGPLDPIYKILNDNPNADYYFHCGDLCNDPNLIKPFLVVKGNNDYGFMLDKQRILEIEGHRILLFHGTSYTYSISVLTEKVKNEKCDILFFGHTHMFLDETINDIRMINPGSCYYNRDLSKPCYAIVNIDIDNIKVEKIEL